MDVLNNGGKLIQRVYRANAEIMLSGDKVRVQPVSSLPKKLCCQLREHREDVVQALKYFPATLLIEAHRRTWFDYGYEIDPSVFVNLIPPSEWKHVSECDEYDLEPQAKELALRAVLHCGRVPRDWNKVLHCTHCGWVFSPVVLECDSCPWCEAKKADVEFATPGLNRCSEVSLIKGRVVQECEVQDDLVIIQHCFFCGERHQHGTGAKPGEEWKPHAHEVDGILTFGHRVKHCIRQNIEIELNDGTVVSNQDGYFLGI